MKDSLDNERTSEIQFPEEPAEFTPNADEKLMEIIETTKAMPEIPPGPEFKSTLTLEEIANAEKEIRGRSFSGRRPELGKMIKCQVHGFRHREFEFGLKCEQKFTNRIGDYELLREEVDQQTGEIKLVPAYRTAQQPDSQPTKRQVVGAAAFARKRVTPRYSPLARLLVYRTREIFESRGFSLETKTEEETEEFKKNLRNAKNIAARELGKRFGISRREFQRRGLL